MKVVFDKAKLIAALTPAAGISQIKNTLQVIEGLLFECPPDPSMGAFEGGGGDICRISAFDLEKGLRNTVECKIYGEGKYVINASKILQIVRALPDGDITIEVDQNCRATLTGGSSCFEISVFPGDDFPMMPQMRGERRYNIPQHIIRKLICQTMFAAAQNDPKPAFNGELLKIKDGYITMVGCDGNRLSCASAEYEDDVPECEIIIPAKFLSELLRLLKDTEDETTMIIGLKHIIFKIDSIYFFCRMIEGKYLDYEKVLPTTFEKQAFVSADELRGALERASIISEDKLGGNSKAIVKMVFGEDNINVSAVSSSGSIYENVPAAMGGDEMIIGFTCRLLLDALRAIPETVHTVRLGLNGADKGICIEPCGGSRFINKENPNYAPSDERSSEDNGFDMLHFVMPRRITK